MRTVVKITLSATDVHAGSSRCETARSTSGIHHYSTMLVARSQSTTPPSIQSRDHCAPMHLHGHAPIWQRSFHEHQIPAAGLQAGSAGCPSGKSLTGPLLAMLLLVLVPLAGAVLILLVGSAATADIQITFRLTPNEYEGFVLTLPSVISIPLQLWVADPATVL